MSDLYHWLWRLGPANPILIRVVHGGSRRMRHLWVRMGYLGLLILLLLLGMAGSQGVLSSTGADVSDLAKAGANLFSVISYGQILLVCLIAPIFMAGAISQEQAGETFEILLTTPMSNLQIVLGSLLSRLYFIIALLLSGLPLFAVLLIVGGVPLASVGVSFLVASVTALFVGSVAITLAVLRKGGRKAVFGFVVAIVAYLVLIWLIDFVLIRVGPGFPAIATAAQGDPFASLDASGATTGSTSWVTTLHPLLVLRTAMDPVNYGPPVAEDLAFRNPLIRGYLANPVTTYSLLCVLASAAMIIWSAVQVRALGEGFQYAWIPERMRRFLRINPGEKRRDPREVTGNPIAWREAKTRGKQTWSILTRWGFALSGLVVGLLLTAGYHTDGLPRVSGTAAESFQTLLIGVLLTQILVIVLIALYMSAGCVSREREDGTLDLILTTPVTPKFYVWGKLRGLVQFISILLLAPILTLAVACLYSLAGQVLGWDQVTVQYSLTQGGSGPGAVIGPVLLPEAALLMPVMIVPFVAMCVAIGMYWSLRSRGVFGAVVPSIAIVAVLGLVLGFCGVVSLQIPLIGPMLNALSPTTNLIMIISPWGNVEGFGDTSASNRALFGFAALLAAGVYSLVVWSTITSMVNGFDFTVRRLSGAN